MYKCEVLSKKCTECKEYKKCKCGCKKKDAAKEDNDPKCKKRQHRLPGNDDMNYF